MSLELPASRFRGVYALVHSIIQSVSLGPCSFSPKLVLHVKNERLRLSATKTYTSLMDTRKVLTFMEFLTSHSKVARNLIKSQTL